jgi:hypothetical protein
MDQTLAPAPEADRLPRHRGIFIVLFGIALPTITYVMELATRMCANMFLDPLPTLAHVFAVFIVPLAAGFSLRALWRRDGERLQAVIFAQAVAAAIAGVYTLIFAPLMGMAGFALISYMAIGILPLAPALALAASLRALFALLRLQNALDQLPGRARPARRTVWAGLAAGVGLMLALHVPATATRLLVTVATSDDPATSETGVRWLRRIGSRDAMLRACHHRPMVSVDIMGHFLDMTAPVPPEKARDIYHRVTGRTYDSEPLPHAR